MAKMYITSFQLDVKAQSRHIKVPARAGGQKELLSAKTTYKFVLSAEWIHDSFPENSEQIKAKIYEMLKEIDLDKIGADTEKDIYNEARQGR